MTLSLRASKGAVLVPVHAQPGASRDELAGLHGDRLKVRVSAAAEAGKANRAIEALVAEALALPARAVRVVAGATSRRKTLAVEGLEPDDVRERLGTHAAT